MVVFSDSQTLVTVRDTEYGWVDVESWINYKLNDPMINEALTLAENIELYKVGI